MKKIKNQILFLFALLLSTSCLGQANDPNSELSLQLGVEIQDINKSIVLVDAPEMANSHLNGDLLSFRLFNRSNENIVFDGGFDLRLLIRNGDAWEVGQNNFGYSTNSFELPPTSDYPVGFVVDVVPYIDGLKSPLKIRVIINGQLITSKVPVAAFIDVIINP